jgi:hypothetical protein
MKNIISSLFPVVPSSLTSKRWIQDNAVRTIYFIFSLEKSLGNYVLKKCELPYTTFLPKRLFGKLLCRTLEWCSKPSKSEVDLSEFTLCKNHAILQAAGHWFRMSLVEANHCVRVDVVCGDDIRNFVSFVRELCRHWRTVASSGLQSLTVEPFVSYLGLPNHHLLLVSIRGVLGANPVPLRLSLTGESCTFHCFLSHRWGAFDKRLMKSLHAHLTCGVVRGLGIRVFLDDTSFQAGDHFRQVFVESILATEVFVPLVTANAVDRLTRHDPQELDNLLIEWLTALLLLKFPDLDRNGSRFPLRFIIPICVEDCSQASYFTMVSSLSRVVPVKSILELKDMLAKQGICLSETVERFLERVTVKDVVEGIMANICLPREEEDDQLSTVTECNEKIMELLLRTDGITVPCFYLSRVDEVFMGPATVSCLWQELTVYCIQLLIVVLVMYYYIFGACYCAALLRRS